MDHKDHIDDYIAGNLAPDQLQVFEEAMAQDPELRKEVNLQRQIFDHFRDAGRQRLLSVIDEVTKENSIGKKESTQPPPNRFRWLKWFGLSVFLIAATWFIWRPSAVQEEYVPSKQEGVFPPPPVPRETPEEEPPAETNELRANVEEKPPMEEGLLAAVDPRDFAVNPSMESLMTGMRVDEVDIELTSPTFSESGFKSKKGRTTISFAGIATGLINDGLILQIFSNRDINRPLQTYPIEITETLEDKATFGSTFQLKLKPGLYYFSILTASDEAEVYIGKFKIDQP